MPLRLAAVVSLLALVCCRSQPAYPEGTIVAVPSLIPDEEGYTVEPFVRSVSSDDPSIVKVLPPDPTSTGYRGYNIFCREEGTTNVRIETDTKSYVIAVNVFDDFTW